MRAPFGIVRATLQGAGAHGVTIGAAGCAFFTVLALFPAMSLLIDLYGLLLNPRSVEVQMNTLGALLPHETFLLIDRWTRHLVLHSKQTLGTGVVISTLLTLFSAGSGTRALLATLAATHGGTRITRAWRQQVVALGVTMAAILAAVLAVAMMTLMPVAMAMLNLRRPFTPVMHAIGTVMLIGIGGVFLGLLYRAALPGPPLASGRRRHVVPGAVLATTLWLLASWLVSFYADHLARLATTYGPIGAVVGLMLWLYATFYAALIGAEFNAQLNRAASGAPVAASGQLRVAE
ncbi:MAG TPA: YihY/virulence factor BrkB family protein [Acetobacteraceae bacterium]|jgi:membrane protein|nr:YihY/virulence factor BrkB family protein [Acetobacteraceae bacterium]